MENPWTRANESKGDHNQAGYARMRQATIILATTPQTRKGISMNAREERGLVIAATQKLTNKGKVWLVPSQSGRGKYTVCPDPENPYCSCPDHEDHGGMCKHLYAVQVTLKREQGMNGDIVETKTLTLTEKKVYRQQDWPTYALAQREEKRRFQTLLHDLCRGLRSPEQTGQGRRWTPMADMVFTAVYKVYSTLSCRRFGTDLDEAFEKGFISKKLNPAMSCTFLECELLTPILKELIAKSAAPLRAVETEFAVDSSGFSTSRFVKWFDEKYGTTRSGRQWVKCHIACGVKTHVVTAVEILDKDAADSPQFKPLMKTTATNFKIGEVSADKAYLSTENIDTVFQFGGTPYIAFKANSTGAAGGLFEKMFHYYSMNKDEYMARYHKRSNVESVFSMAKAKFGDSVRSRTDVAMVNEALCKFIAHNLCCLIMSQFELGIAPIFWGEENTEAIQAEVIEAETVEPVAPIQEPVTVETSRSEPRYWSCVGA